MARVLAQRGLLDAEGEKDDPALEYVGMDWLEFMRDVLGLQGRYSDGPRAGELTGELGLWDFQRAAIEELRDHRICLWATAFNVGKTFLLGQLVPTFLCTMRDSMVIVTGPGERQLGSQVWNEVRGAQAGAATMGHTLPGKIAKDLWAIDPMRHPKWFARYFSTDDPGKAHGYHAKAFVPEDPNVMGSEAVSKIEKAMRRGFGSGPILLIVDEAASVRDDILQALKGVESQGQVYVIYSGNPPASLSNPNEFLRGMRPGSRFRRLVVRIEKPPWPSRMQPHREWVGIPGWLASPSYLAARKKDWGPDNANYISKIYAEPPSGETANQLVTHDMFTAALAINPRKRIIEDEGGDLMRGKHIGVDCARSAKGDFNVLSLFVDGIKTRRRRWRGQTIHAGAGKIVAASKEWGGKEPIPGECIHVDQGGLGVGICDELDRLGVYCDRVDYGSTKEHDDWPELDGQTKFVSRKTQLYWRMRRAISLGWVRIPEAFEMSWEEGMTYTYDYDGKQRVKIVEDKDAIREILGRSTDDWDADCNALSRSGGGAIQFGSIEEFDF
jgi:hypothetical protein